MRKLCSIGAVFSRRVLAPSLLALAACNGNGKDPKLPGDSLGTFRVAATLEESSCGTGALGSSDVWEFDVGLSRRDQNLYWLNGAEAIPGNIAPDGVSFAFDTRVAVEVEPAGKGRLGCTVWRSDQASGTLGAPTTDVVSFDGRLRFQYSAQPTSDCSELIGVEGGFMALPCEMTYDLSGTRVAAPE
jgi:hypothetical protein